LLSLLCDINSILLKDENLLDSLEIYCNVKKPFNVIQELQKADVDITINILEHSKYEDLQNQPVRAFLYLNRNITHHCRDWRIEPHEIVGVYMSKRMMIRFLIPKILRWADSNLNTFKHSIGEKLDFLRSNFSKEKAAERKTIIIKHPSFERFGARALEFQGSSFEEFEIFLRCALQLSPDSKMSYYSEYKGNSVGIYDFNDIRDGMTVFVHLESVDADPETTSNDNPVISKSGKE
jgi:hypothetical protein